MVLVFANKNDVFVNEVVERVESVSEVVKVVTGKDVVDVVIEMNNDSKVIVLSINKGEKKVYIDDVLFVWYQRGCLVNSDEFYDLPEFNIYRNYFADEIQVVRDFLSYRLSEKKILGSYEKEKYVNKLQNLNVASECGLLIPPTIVTSQKDDIDYFIKKYGKVIVKPLKHPFLIQVNSEIYVPNSGILVVTSSDGFPQKFPYVLLQKYIDKKYEVRSFFVGNEFYSSAIFSQDNEYSVNDMRDVNVNSLRVTPYKLPLLQKEMLIAFMKNTGHNIGAVDFVVDEKENLFFLEVNPTGHFAAISFICNFFIEKRIADYIIERI